MTKLCKELKKNRKWMPFLSRVSLHAEQSDVFQCKLALCSPVLLLVFSVHKSHLLMPWIEMKSLWKIQIFVIWVKKINRLMKINR